MSKIYLDLSNYKNTFQLESENHLAESAVSLTNKQKLSLYKKSQKSGYSTDVLEEVYRRGHMIWKPELFEGTREQFAFDRVNSFISGGFAADLDRDLMEKEVWDKPNPVKHHKTLSPEKKAAAKARAKAAGRPYPNMVDNMWAARNEEYTGSEPVSKDPNNPLSRQDGTDSAAALYAKDTPYQGTLPHHKKKKAIAVIKEVVTEGYICENCDCGLFEEILNERGKDSKGYFRSTESGAGLTAKGAKHFGVQTAVTEKNPTGKRAARRRSFCARMSGMKGPMKDEKGRPTRKAMSLRRWRC